MFGFFKKNRELESLLGGILSNEANNYKDAAQECLKEFEAKYNELAATNALNDKQKEYYGRLLSETQSRLQKFTHKDQKPYWT